MHLGPQIGWVVHRREEVSRLGGKVAQISGNGLKWLRADADAPVSAFGATDESGYRLGDRPSSGSRFHGSIAGSGVSPDSLSDPISGVAGAILRAAGSFLFCFVLFCFCFYLTDQ